MNLRDRMNSDSQNKKLIKTENEPKQNSKNTTENSNPQPQDLILQKQSETIQSLQAELSKTSAELDLLKKQGRTQDQDQIQRLLSEKSELTSVITELRTTLSVTQRTNQSLSMNNRALVKQNDDLRNNNGLKLRNEQIELIEDLEDTQALNVKLREMVDKSSVEAVDKANAERNQAIRDCKKKIADTKSKATHDTYEAHEKQRKAEAEAKEAKEILEKRSFVYFGLLAFTLLCCGIMNTVVRNDIIDFFVVSATAIYQSLTAYLEWFSSLSGEMDWYWIWLLFILFTAAILLCLCGIVIESINLYQKYKKRWCTLSMKALVGSIAVLTVFAEPIRRFIPINLVILFFLSQLGYLFLLWYFDGYYDIRCRSDEWKQIQNG